MDWEAAKVFLNALRPVENRQFKEWWEQHWLPHQKKCFDAAGQHFIKEKSLSIASSIEELDTLMRKMALDLDLDVEDFMYFAWPIAQKKFNAEL